MFTLIFLFFLSIVFVVIAYLIRFKKRYDLIAGYSDYNKNGEENIKFKAILTAVLYMCIYFFLTKTRSLGEIIILVLLLGSFIYFIIDGFRYVYKINFQ